MRVVHNNKTRAIPHTLLHHGSRYCGVLLGTVVPENVVVPGRPEGPFVLILFVIGMMLSFVGAFGFGVMALVHMPMLLSGATSYVVPSPPMLANCDLTVAQVQPPELFSFFLPT